MADLEIQRRKRSIWPWILAALALIAVIWIAMEMFGADDDDDLADDAVVTEPALVQDEMYPVETPAAAPGDIQAFRSQCGTAATMRDEMAADHSFAANCLTQMSAALNAAISRDTVGDQALAQRLAVLEQSAQQLTRDPQSTEHAGQLREAMQEAASVIERVAEKRTDVSTELREHVTALNSAVDELGRTELLLEQKRAAARYFEHAAQALEIMNRSQGGQS